MRISIVRLAALAAPPAGPVLVLALVLALLLSLAGSPAFGQSDGAQAGRLTDSFLETFNRAFSAGNLEPWMALWAENAERSGPRGSQRGKAEIRKVYENLYSGFEGLNLGREVRRVIQGRVVAWEGVVTGVHRETSKPIALPIVAILAFGRANLIGSAHFYLDLAGLGRQLKGDGTDY